MIVWDTLGAAFLTRRGILPSADLNDHLMSMSLAQAAALFPDGIWIVRTIATALWPISPLKSPAFIKTWPWQSRACRCFWKRFGEPVSGCVSPRRRITRGGSRAPSKWAAALFCCILTSATVGSGKDHTCHLRRRAGRTGHRTRKPPLCSRMPCTRCIPPNGQGIGLTRCRMTRRTGPGTHPGALADRYFQTFDDIKVNDAGHLLVI